MAQGIGHAGCVTACKYSPDGKFLVSGSLDGAIFMWKIPDQFQHNIKAKSESNLRKSNTSIHLKQPEQIRQITSKRSNRLSSHVAECPPIDPSSDMHFETASISGESTISTKKKV